MRFVSLALVLLAAGVAYVLPQPSPPEPGPAAGVAEPAVAVCAIEEGAGRSTEISIASTVDGPTQLTIFAGGNIAGSIGQRTGRSGSTVVPVVDVAAVGTVEGLVEMPVATSAAAAVVAGSESLSAESCGTVPAPVTLITGGSTVSGETFDLHLMNPYAGEAIVELAVESESGKESSSRFDSVIVPARDSRIVDFTDLVPGRETLTVVIKTLRGRVMAVGRQGAEGESAVWKAVEPGQDWFLPVPSGSGSKSLLIASSADGDVAYQVDLYSSDGFEEGFISDTLPARGRHTIDLAEIGEGALGVRVLTAGPVVAVLWAHSEDGIAATTGTPMLANRWFLPGASAIESGWARVVILNAGIEDSTVTVRPLRDGTRTRVFMVESDGVLEFGLEQADGYLIDSTGPVSVVWTAQRGGAALLASGVPVLDG